MTLCFTNLGGRASPTNFTAAVAAALFMICSGPKAELFASSGFVVALCFAIPGGRASPAGIATAVTTALGVLLALEQEGPASEEDTAMSDSVVVLRFAIPGGRASPAGLACTVRSQEAQLP